MYFRRLLMISYVLVSLGLPVVGLGLPVVLSGCGAGGVEEATSDNDPVMADPDNDPAVLEMEGEGNAQP